MCLSYLIEILYFIFENILKRETFFKSFSTLKGKVVSGKPWFSHTSERSERGESNIEHQKQKPY